MSLLTGSPPWSAANLKVDAGALLLRRRGWIAYQIADEVQADVVLVGARGLGGAKAVLGSVSDMVVHTSERPVVVVPHPMLAAEYAALADGPVVVGWDGSAGAQTAFATTTRLFPDRDVVLVSVDERDGEVPSGPSDAGGRQATRLNAERGHGFHTRAMVVPEPLSG